MVSVRGKGKLAPKVLAETGEPIVVFDMNSLGLNGDRLLRDLHESFETLEWDYYDVRREQLKVIDSVTSLGGMLQGPAKDFYSGSIGLEEFLAQIPEIPTAIRAHLDSIRPYRRRATAIMRLSRTDEATWAIVREPVRAIAQNVSASDYRSVERRFGELGSELVDHPDFKRLLGAIGDLVVEAEGGPRDLRITCWQTGIVARADRSASNSPEGIHQDGADYIVSALVMERLNVRGGTSRVFGPDRSTQILEVTLEPGQGIFQADAGSTLWHDVTPVLVDDKSEAEGIRNILGFDIHVLGKDSTNGDPTRTD